MKFIKLHRVEGNTPVVINVEEIIAAVKFTDDEIKQKNVNSGTSIYLKQNNENLTGISVNESPEKIYSIIYDEDLSKKTKVKN